MNVFNLMSPCYNNDIKSNGGLIMPTDKRVFTLRLQEDNFNKIKYIAEKNKRSIAMQIEYLVEQFIDEYEKCIFRRKMGRHSARIWATIPPEFG